MSPTVSRNLKTVFHKSNQPTDKNYDPQRRILETQMPIPGNGHKNIGNGEQDYSGHVKIMGQELKLYLTTMSPDYLKLPQSRLRQN